MVNLLGNGASYHHPLARLGFSFFVPILMIANIGGSFIYASLHQFGKKPKNSKVFVTLPLLFVRIPLLPSNC
jgi:hypothetical protein